MNKEEVILAELIAAAANIHLGREDYSVKTVSNAQAKRALIAVFQNRSIYHEDINIGFYYPSLDVIHVGEYYFSAYFGHRDEEGNLVILVRRMDPKEMQKLMHEEVRRYCSYDEEEV